MKILLASLHPFVPEVIYPEYAYLSALTDTSHELHVLRLGENPLVLPGLCLIHQDCEKDLQGDLFENAKRFEKRLKSAFPGFSYHGFDELILKEDLHSYARFYDSLNLNQDLSNYNDVKIEDVNLGECSIFLALRRKQIGDLSHVDDLTRDSFQKQLKAGYLVQRALKNLLSSTGEFDALVLSHYNYTICKVAYQVLLSRNPDLFFTPLTTANLMNQTVGHRFIIWEQKEKHLNKYFQLWNEEKPFPLYKLEKVKKHYSAMYSGRSFRGYSASLGEQRGEFYQAWGFTREKPLYVAYLSGSQERFAARAAGCEDIGSYLFKDQVEWVRYLKSEFSKNQQVQLVIRPHPREVMGEEPTKQYQTIEEVLCDAPSNIHWNTPDESISSYDLMQHAQAILVSWSTTTVEASMLGIPVLGYMVNHDTYPMWDLGYAPESKEEYDEILKRWLQNPPEHSVEIARKALKWLSYYVQVAHVDLEPVVNYRKWILSPWSDSYLRKMSRLVNGFYDPFHLDELASIPTGNEIQSAFSNRTPLMENTIKPLLEIKENSELDQVKELLSHMGRKLFGLPLQYRIRYCEEVPMDIEPGVFYLTRRGEKASGLSLKVQPGHQLLDFFAREIYS